MANDAHEVGMALVRAPDRDLGAAPEGLELVTTTTATDEGPFRDQPRTAIELRGRVWEPSRLASGGSLVVCAGMIADWVLGAPSAVVLGLLVGGTVLQIARIPWLLRTRKLYRWGVLVGLHDDHIEIGSGRDRKHIALDAIARCWVQKVHARTHPYQLYLQDRSGGTAAVINGSLIACEYAGRLIAAHVRRYWQRLEEDPSRG